MTLPLVAPLFGDSLENDELVVRFGKKRRYRYLWIVVSRLSRQVLAHFVGKRSRSSLRQLRQRIPPVYRRKLVDTDAYHVYGAAPVAASFQSERAWPHQCARGLE